MRLRASLAAALFACSVWTVVGAEGCAAEQAQVAQVAQLRFWAEVDGRAAATTPVRLPLPQAVLAETSKGFSDLRLFDDRGVETPYVIYPEYKARQTPQTFPFTIISYQVGQSPDDGDEIVLEQPRENDTPGTRTFRELEFVTPGRNFIKSVRIQAGQAGDDAAANWQDIATDTIFDFSAQVDLRKTTISFPETNASYVKVVLQDATQPVSSGSDISLRYDGLEFSVAGEQTSPFRIDKILARSGTAEAARRFYTQTSFPSPQTVLDTDGNTLLHLGRVNLPLAEIALSIDNPYYYRRVEVWSAEEDEEDAYRQTASGVVYTIPWQEKPERVIPVNRPQQPYVRIKILNGDNPPLRIRQVDVSWVRHNLYFIPETGRRYRLYFGGQEIDFPEYELGKLLRAGYATLQAYPAWTVGQVHANTDYDPSLTGEAQAQIERLVFSILVLLLAGGLGWWGYQLVKKILAQSGE